nr:heme attachment to plastid cytochrome c [Follicularia botryoides]
MSSNCLQKDCFIMAFYADLANLQNFANNSCFLCLLLSMIFYWIQTFFKAQTRVLGSLTMIFANICLFLLLVLRWKESGHFPLSNLYESLIFLSWTFTTIHLVLEKTTQIPFIGAMTSPSALLTNAFATFSLPNDMQQSGPLVPALQSNWLMMHVTVMIVSYAALICGSLLSIAFLILYKNLPEQIKKNDLTIDWTMQTKALNSEQNQLSLEQQAGLALASGPFAEQTQQLKQLQTSNLLKNLEQNPQKVMNSLNKFKLAQTLDNLSYRILGLGFPFLTIGILSGAVWANEAWGSYWSWDPKETWALLTWLVFAIYLHTRFSKGWQGEKPAIIASFGFIVVWICYLGVNLMGEGLHSYGWLR